MRWFIAMGLAQHICNRFLDNQAGVIFMQQALRQTSWCTIYAIDFSAMRLAKHLYNRFPGDQSLSLVCYGPLSIINARHPQKHNASPTVHTLANVVIFLPISVRTERRK